MQFQRFQFMPEVSCGCVSTAEGFSKDVYIYIASFFVDDI